MERVEGYGSTVDAGRRRATAEITHSPRGGTCVPRPYPAPRPDTPEPLCCSNVLCFVHCGRVEGWVILILGPIPIRNKLSISARKAAVEWW